MKRLLVGISALLCCSLASAQSVKVSELVYQTDSYNKYRLPWVTQSDNPQSAQRINDAIFSRSVAYLPGNDPQLTLNNAVKQGIDGVASLDYGLVESNDNFITLAIFTEFCGAYCESDTSQFSFDLKHGTGILLTDIIRPEALSSINDMIKANIRGEIDALIKRQNKSPTPVEKQDEDYVDYQAFYGDCWVMRDEGETLFTNSFSLEKGKLVFFNDRCSNHASRALDELGEFTTKIAVSKIADLLTPYGRSLLSGKKDGVISPPAQLFNRMLYGTIGNKTSIAINANCLSKSVNGAYFYTKYGQPIELNGSCQSANTPSVVMTTSSGDTAAERIELTLKEGQYQGSWISQGKTLPITILLP
ncbi:hypothetical protein [Pragia fontium]|uniref:hypothetical protein n=1 Tax=Pragia fontium TaxID=82985 RepID=UPI00069B9A28|nr:hypothetical protein [Pragia fontium]